MSSQALINLKHTVEILMNEINARFHTTVRKICHTYSLYKIIIGGPSHSSTTGNLVDLCTDKNNQYLQT